MIPAPPANFPRLIYSLTVPSNLDSLAVLEGLCETFITESDSVAADIATILRLSVAEACRNALSLSQPEGRLGLTTLSFFRVGPDDDVRGIALEITDSGEGLMINQKHPPYPASMVGKRFVLAEPLDQQIVARVEGPLGAVLISRELDTQASILSREMLIAGAPEHGLGLLALCRCWGAVRFTHVPGKGTTLRLERAALKA